MLHHVQTCHCAGAVLVIGQLAAVAQAQAGVLAQLQIDARFQRRGVACDRWTGDGEGVAAGEAQLGHGTSSPIAKLTTQSVYAPPGDFGSILCPPIAEH